MVVWTFRESGRMDFRNARLTLRVIKLVSDLSVHLDDSLPTEQRRLGKLRMRGLFF